MMRLMMRLRRKERISCARVQDLVQAHLDGELEGPDRARLIAHLDRCRPCGIEAATYDRIKASLAGPALPESVERLSRFAASISDDPPEG